MRVYNLMLLVFIFSLSLGIVKQLDLFGSADTGIGSIAINGQTEENYLNSKTSSMKAIGGAGVEDGAKGTGDFSYLNAMYNVIVKGIPFIVTVLFDATVGLPLLLGAVGVPSVLAWPIGLMGILIYLVGIMQWITGKSFREHE